MRKILALTLLFVLVGVTAARAVGSDKAEYVGGTISAIKEKSEGTLNTKGENEMVFTAKSGSVTIPYASIESLEYGQKAGRRIGVAIMAAMVADAKRTTPRRPPRPRRGRGPVRVRPVRPQRVAAEEPHDQAHRRQDNEEEHRQQHASVEPAKDLRESPPQAIGPPEYGGRYECRSH